MRYGHILNVLRLVSKTMHCDHNVALLLEVLLEVLSLQEIMNGNLERQTYIGHEAQHMRGVLALKHPIKNGIICNWDEMEKVSRNSYA